MKRLSAVAYVRIFLLITAAALVWGLVVCPKPWVSGVSVMEEAGKDVDYPNFMASYLWPMAAVNLVLCGLLFFVAPWLVRPVAEKRSEFSKIAITKAQRILLMLCLGISTVTTLYYTVPRMTKSLWVDEERTVRQNVFGNHARVNEKGRSMAFGEFTMVKPIPWSATVWRYRTPNNHPFFSLTSRISHEVTTKISKPYPLHFREWAVRLPALIAGVGALFAVAWLLLGLGFVKAAMIAPLLLSVHAYFLRFSSDARGYSMTFVLLPLCALFLWKGIRSGQWRWWVGFALAQFLVAWSHGSSLYFLVVLNLWGFAVPWLWKGGLPKSERLAINGRHFLMSCFSGMAFLQMFLPNLAQASSRFAETEGGGTPDDIGIGKIKEMLSYYFSGISWRGLAPEHPFSHKMADQFEGMTGLMWVYLTILTVFFVIGLVRIWNKGGATRWFASVVLVPGPFMYAVSYAKGFFMFEQYIIFVVPWIAITLALGLALIVENCGKYPAVGVGVVALFVGMQWWVCEPQRTEYRNRPIEQNLEAVVMAHGSLDPAAEGYHDVITAGFVRYPRTYDPYVYPIKKIKDVDRLVAMSNESGKPLWFYLGTIGFSEQIGMPVVTHIRENSKMVTRMYGLDGMSPIDMYLHEPVEKSAEPE